MNKIAGNIFEHDCDKCHYLGTIRYPEPLSTGKQVFTNADLYFCANSYDDSLIARFSSEGSDYASCMHSLVEQGLTPDSSGRKGWSTAGPALATALLFAKVKGLI